jgi:hypothetical protein
LQQWLNGLNFVSCEYKDGRFQYYDIDLIEPEIQFMEYTKIHLESAYKEQFIDPVTVQSKRKRICDEIGDFMRTPPPYSPHSATFETIITNRIKSRCSHLQATENTDPDPHDTNFYIDFLVYQIIFEMANQRRQLSLRVKPTYEKNMYELIQGGGSTVARCDEQSMTELKTVLEELVSNEQIHSFLESYNKKLKQLENDVNIKNLKLFVEKLVTLITGGQLLGGFKSCELCLPGDLSQS